MTEKKIAEIFEHVGLAKIVRELKNDVLTNVVQSAMIELAKDTSDKLKQVVINQKAIDYINANKERFEMTLPVIGECWNIDKIITYPLVNEGKPVLELSREENFMRLPKELFD